MGRLSRSALSFTGEATSSSPRPLGRSGLQPDRPKGRGLELVASPVKESALRLNLPIYQPERIKTNEELQTRLREIAPDAIIVVGYGRIIPKWMLELPRYGNINLHGSLLP